MSAPSLDLRDSLPSFSVKKRLEKSASRAASTCIAVAVTFLSLLAGTAGAATAQELFIHKLAILAGDLASWQLDQAKPAGRSNPQARGAPGTTARFDVTTMLPIESIDAQTSVTVFLRDGVPNELQLAALRRAWTVDPAIRGFRGLQENDWNFNGPGVPGFGGLGPEVDVKRMVAKVFGEAPRLSLAAAAAGNNNLKRDDDSSQSHRADDDSSQSHRALDSQKY
jgi:hypothetical protein